MALRHILAALVALIGFSAWTSEVRAQGAESAPVGVEDMAPNAAPKPAPGWLGVMLETPDDEPGVDVVQVLRGSPAEGGGLSSGDRILRVDGQEVGSTSDVQRLVRAHPPGHSATLDIRRADKKTKIAVKLGKSPGLEQVLRTQFIGHPAPAFKAKGVGDSASDVELAKLAGKPVVIDFWATWCGPCRPLSKRLGKLSDELGERAHFVGLTSEKKPDVEAFLASKPHGFPVGCAEDKVMQTYLVSSYPTVFVIGPNGEVAGVFVGLGHFDEIRKLVEKLAE